MTRAALVDLNCRLSLALSFSRSAILLVDFTEESSSSADDFFGLAGVPPSAAASFLAFSAFRFSRSFFFSSGVNAFHCSSVNRPFDDPFLDDVCAKAVPNDTCRWASVMTGLKSFMICIAAATVGGKEFSTPLAWSFLMSFCS